MKILLGKGLDNILNVQELIEKKETPLLITHRLWARRQIADGHPLQTTTQKR
jgi:hypothetical protein